MADPYGFWTFAGKNALKGVASSFEELPDGRVITIKDPQNPAVVEDEFILDALSRSRIARRQYNLLYPDLLDEEKDRLDTLIAQNPRISKLLKDDKDFADNIQEKAIKGIPVRTVGPRGGKSIRTSIPDQAMYWPPDRR